MQTEAELRREARRRRILENAEKRMGSILGTEGKTEPGLEDGSFRTTKSAQEALKEFQVTGQSPVRECKKGEKSGKDVDVAFVSPDKAYRPTSGPVHRPQNDHLHWTIALITGLLLRLIWVPWSGTSVWVPWGVVIGTGEAVRYGQGGVGPPRGPLVDVLLFAGLSQPLVNIGFTVGCVMWRVVSDTAVMLFGLLFAHLFLAAFPY